MAKNPIQDVVSKEIKGIRRIPVTLNHNESPHISERTETLNRKIKQKPEPPQMIFRRDGHNGKRSRGKNFLLWTIAVIALVVLLFAVSSIFATAQVNIIVKSQKINTTGSYQAVSTPLAGAISYQVMTVSKNGSVPVNASGEKKTETKASGQIFIYNNYSKASQKLIANTRFQTASGLIYRIGSPVVVPGYTVSADGKIIPGSIEVNVTADKAGVDYNIGSSDLTIPGFSGDPRFKTIFGRVATSIDGGFSGMQKIVSVNDLAVAKTQIETKLKDLLASSTLAQLPKGFILYPNSQFTEYKVLANTTSSDGKVMVNEQGTVHAIIINQDSLIQEIAKRGIVPYNKEPVNMSGLDKLNFTLGNISGSKPWEAKTISFTLSGEVTATWAFDKDALKNDLLGKSPNDLGTVLSKYPQIIKASATTKPFGFFNFPTKSDKIEIIDDTSI